MEDIAREEGGKTWAAWASAKGHDTIWARRWIEDNDPRVLVGSPCVLRAVR